MRIEYDEPEYRSPDVYERARDEFVSSFETIRGVKAIYGTGEVSAPGFSDIDFILVVDDDVAGDRIRTEWNRIRREYSYVLMHPPLVLSRDHFPELPLLRKVDHLRHRSGEEIQFDSDFDAGLANSMIFFDIVYRKWYTEPLSWLSPDEYLSLPSDLHHHSRNVVSLLNTVYPFDLPSRRKINLRFVMCRLHNFKHDVDLVSDAFGIEREYPSIDAIEDFRNNYWEGAKDRYDVLDIIWEHLRDSHDLLKACMDEQAIYTDMGSSEPFTLPGHNTTYVSDAWREFSAEELIRIRKRYDLNIRILPPEIAFHLQASHLTLPTTISGRTHTEAQTVIERRNAVVAEHAEFLSRNDLNFLISPFHLPLEWPNGLTGWQSKFTDAVNRRIMNRIFER